MQGVLEMSSRREERIRELIGKVLDSRDEEVLARDLQELRGLIHEHLEEARDLMRASYACRSFPQQSRS
jgi:hypothetical protein